MLTGQRHPGVAGPYSPFAAGDPARETSHDDSGPNIFPCDIDCDRETHLDGTDASCAATLSDGL